MTHWLFPWSVLLLHCVFDLLFVVENKEEKKTKTTKKSKKSTKTTKTTSSTTTTSVPFANPMSTRAATEFSRTVYALCKMVPKGKITTYQKIADVRLFVFVFTCLFVWANSETKHTNNTHNTAHRQWQVCSSSGQCAATQSLCAHRALSCTLLSLLCSLGSFVVRVVCLWLMLFVFSACWSLT